MLSLWPASTGTGRCAHSLFVRREGRQGFFGEEQFLGLQPQTGSGGCPTTRVPPNGAPDGNSPPKGPLPPGAALLPPLNADTMLTWLRQLGIGTEVIAQVTSKLPPPLSLPHRKSERLVLDLANKKEQLQGAL